MEKYNFYLPEDKRMPIKKPFFFVGFPLSEVNLFTVGADGS
jgi:hypothetical protein